MYFEGPRLYDAVTVVCWRLTPPCFFGRRFLVSDDGDDDVDDVHYTTTSLYSLCTPIRNLFLNNFKLVISINHTCIGTYSYSYIKEKQQIIIHTFSFLII